MFTILFKISEHPINHQSIQHCVFTQTDNSPMPHSEPRKEHGALSTGVILDANPEKGNIVSSVLK